jgi:hypothetical protein
MTRTQETDSRPQDRRDTFDIKDQGPISERTHGTPLDYPWYELGAPPYNHWCPDC